MKFKKIPPDYITVILDRLFRLKPAYERYERVFSDIINKFLIKESKEEINQTDLNLEEKINLAVQIFNSSLNSNVQDDFLQNYIKSEEDRLYNKNSISEIYLNVQLNYHAALELIKENENLKDNLKFLIKLIGLKQNPKAIRAKYSLRYPIEKILLCEGATEEILLEELCKICGYDFKKEGIYVLGAGGKNQVARKYYSMIEEIKIPIFILLDSDAIQTQELILPKLRAQDKIYIIKSGEFEDILPKNLIINALNCRYESCYKCFEEDFHKDTKTTKELYEIFKQKGFGDYKKADFAKTIKEYILKNPPSKEDLTEEIKIISQKISSL